MERYFDDDASQNINAMSCWEEIETSQSDLVQKYNSGQGFASFQAKQSRCYTILSAIRRLNILTSQNHRACVIHIVGADLKEGKDLDQTVDMFNLLYHHILSQGFKSLALLLIGPNVPEELAGTLHQNVQGMKFDIYYSTEEYHIFWESTKAMSKHIIVDIGTEKQCEKGAMYFSRDKSTLRKSNDEEREQETWAGEASCRKGSSGKKTDKVCEEKFEEKTGTAVSKIDESQFRDIIDADFQTREEDLPDSINPKQNQQNKQDDDLVANHVSSSSSCPLEAVPSSYTLPNKMEEDEKEVEGSEYGEGRAVEETYHLSKEVLLYTFGMPNLIVCFNAGVWGYDTWKPTLKYAAMCMKCPTVVTSYTQLEAEDDEDCIAEYLEEFNEEYRTSQLQPLLIIDGIVEWKWRAEKNAFYGAKRMSRSREALGKVYQENAYWQCFGPVAT